MRPLATIAFLATALSAAAAPIHLDFIYQIDSAPMLIDSLRYQNSRGETFSITRLDWLASDFSVTTASGDTLVIPSSHAYIPTRGTTYSLPDLPAEKITAISFKVGPGKEINHSDPSQYTANDPLNPNLNNLHWDWKGGYIFLALEGHWRAPNEKFPGGYAYHFANDPNRTTITLPIDLTPRNESRIAIALDPQKLLTGLSFATDGATTHSQAGDPVALRLKENLPSAFRIVGIQDGGIPTPPAATKPIDLPADPKGFPITLPRHIPLPALPSDNPLITTRVALGEKLFHEPKLSKNNSISCASCHQGETMSDPRKFSTGTEGQLGLRHSMPLFNLAWKSSFFWDGRAPSLRAQALVPIQDHLEMDEKLENVTAKLKAETTYPPLFAAAFGSGEISPENIGLAIETFLLTRLSFNSKLDQSTTGKATLTDEEKRGFELFFTESEPRLGKLGADCFHCHGGALFTDHSFHNNGLTPTDDLGLEKTTGKPNDRHKFSTPSLRNVVLTAPYMHDGRFATLEEVIDHYNSPVARSETLDPNLAKHPQGLGLSDADKAALIAFLKTLSDPALAPP
ncbi:MAG: cytochrome C peroxidase [Gloeobacteraceae cyanobacterium ES-bin-144]|nr:cytochrome C peroxidase [Verrucomicrobiales bacterium]